MSSNGKWLSKVGRFFACGGKSLSNDSSKRPVQERRRGRKKLKRGERNSFVSLFKEPTSSIEKILEDADTEKGLRHKNPSPFEQPKKGTIELSEPVSPRFYTPKAETPRVLSPKAKSPSAHSLRTRSFGEGSGSPKMPSPRRSVSPRVIPPVDLSPTPSPPRPRSPRSSFSKADSCKGIHIEESVSRLESIFPYHHVAATRIQAAYRGYMTRMTSGSARGLVRLQRFVKGESVKRQTENSTKQMQLLVRVKTRLQSKNFQLLECSARRRQELCLGHKQSDSIASDAGNDRDWDDSILSKEEKEARNKRKDDAVRNKERAKTLLQSHQVSKFTSDSADRHTDGLLWSWNTILPRSSMSETPRSPRSSIALRGNKHPTPSRFSQVQTPDRTPRSHYSSNGLLTKYSKPAPRKSQSPSDMNFTDTDSLRSCCSTYSVPRYMTPTASARAKMRLSDSFNDTCISSPSIIKSKRRVSYPLTPRSDASSQRTIRPSHSSGSIRNLIETTTTTGSFPDGRKLFNRFV